MDLQDAFKELDKFKVLDADPLFGVCGEGADGLATKIDY